MREDIVIRGIETHNLKNIDVNIKKNALNLIIGPSGSGKSSLAYDTLAQIGQHEFMSMFADNISEADYKVREYSNIVAAIPIKQTNHNNNIRSTIGTYFGLNPFVILLYASLLKMDDDLFVLNKESNLCPHCRGIGSVKSLDPNKIIDYDMPIKKNPFKCWNRYKDFYAQILEEYCEDEGIDAEKNYKELSKSEKNKLLYGISEKKYSIRYKKTNAFSRRTTRFNGVLTGEPMMTNFNISPQFYSDRICSECGGKRYSTEYDKYKVMGLSIGEFMTTPFNELVSIIDKIGKKNKDSRLGFAIDGLYCFVKKAIELNLGHLYMHRSIPTLSGGELQRLRMVQVFNTQLTELLIVLDEPLAGLSGEERDSVYRNVVGLCPKHTVVVVDHSDVFVKNSKNLIALGETGGKNGGYLIDASKYLKDEKRAFEFEVAPAKKECLVDIQGDIYTYEGVKISVGIGAMNLITGKSGVGKSTLLREYFPQFFDKYEYISQKPLGGNRNSCVATALNVAGDIADAFAKKFKKDKKYFSNLTGNDGACPVCGGAGFVEYSGSAQQKIQLICRDCEGTGFHKRLKNHIMEGKSIFDVWNMTIDESIPYFEKINKKIAAKLKGADEVLLGHLRLGQLTETLSGGENIRLKILKEENTTSQVLGIDEPFKGLGNNEIYHVACYMEKLRRKGKTIIVVEHNDAAFKYFYKKIQLEVKKNTLIGRDLL